MISPFELVDRAERGALTPTQQQLVEALAQLLAADYRRAHAERALHDCTPCKSGIPVANETPRPRTEAAP